MPDNRPPDINLSYRSCFGGKNGEITLEHLLRVCGVFSINNETDPQRMAFNEGRRSIGLHILQMVGKLKFKEEGL